MILKLISVSLYLGLVSCSSSPSGAMVRLSSMMASSYFPEGPQRELAQSAENGNIQKLDEAMAHGASPNFVGAEEMTPLMWSLVKQSKNGYRRLLEQGANPNFKTKRRAAEDLGRSVMMVAAICEDSEFLRLALEYKGNPNSPSKVPTRTIIFDAIENRRINNVETIAKYGGNINHQDRLGDTPIIRAVLASQFDIVYRLLMLGADPKKRSNSGSNVMDLLIKYGDRATYITGESKQREWFQKVVNELKLKNLM